MSSLVIPFGVLMVVGLSFLVDRSSMTKSMKALTRIGVLVVAIVVSFYLLRPTG